MEKYCYWEYLDGTVGAGGFEVRFRVPATRRFSKLVGEQPPRIVDINQVLQAYCDATPELAPILTGTIYIETEQEWKWLNSVLAQHLYSSRLIPAGRSTGAVDMFPLGTLRIEPEPKRPDLDVQRIEKWRQHVAKAILVEARNADGSEKIEGVLYLSGGLRSSKHYDEPRDWSLYAHKPLPMLPQC